jgi:CubicO group peptidase (beta-lactamase class C family)
MVIRGFRGFLALLALFSLHPMAQAQQVEFPGRSWRVDQAADHGLDAAKLDELATRLGGRGCVVSSGAVVKSWGSQSERKDWASSAKPVLSTLLFFAIQEGKVAGVETRVDDLWKGLSPKDQPMTLAHLANMTSGYARPEPPGAAWAYNDYAIMLYQSTLFDRIFRADPDAVAAYHFRDLQLEDGLTFDGRRRMKASVRDFARIAWFWVNKGRWGDQQVLEARFFDQYRKPQVPANLPPSREAETDDYLRIGTYGGGSSHFSAGGPGIYGFNWWFNAPVGTRADARMTWPDAPADTFMSVGAHGHCAVMVPSRGLVLVAAGANWGEHQPGVASSVTNQRIRDLLNARLGRP